MSWTHAQSPERLAQQGAANTYQLVVEISQESILLPAGEGVGAFGSLTLKRQVEDVTYTFKATETTFKNLKGLNGSTLTIAKPFGEEFIKALLERLRI